MLAKPNNKWIITVGIVMLLVVAFPMTVLAAPLTQDGSFPDTIQLVGTIMAALVGWPAFLAAVINLLKVPIPFLKWYGIPDGVAGKVSFWANALAYVLVFVAVYTGKVDWVGNIDLQLGSFANVLLTILAFLASLGFTNLSNKVWKGVGAPGLGRAHPKG